MPDLKKRDLIKRTATIGLLSTFGGAVGSRASQTQSLRNPVTLEMFGAKGDGFDNSAAVTALNIYVAQHVTQITQKFRSNFGYTSSGVVVDLTGLYHFSNTLILYPGVDYRLPVGSILTACEYGQTVVRTASKIELEQIGHMYGNSVVRLSGGGCIDGADLASIGLLADTTTDCSRFDVTVLRCNFRRYSTLCSGAASGNIVTIDKSDKIRPGDTVQISGTADEFFSVVAVSGNRVTLGRQIREDLHGAPFIHRACGVSGIDAQITSFDIQATRNDIGFSFGANSEAIQCTDLRVTGKAEFNMIGLVVVQGDGKFRDITLMHNFERELVYVSGIGGCFDGLYLESLSDNQLRTLQPPVDVATVSASEPLVDVRGGRMIFRNINWPTNPSTTRFRRLMRCHGNIIVDGLIGATVPLRKNPVRGDDIAPFEQIEGGKLEVHNVQGWTNISSSDALMFRQPR